MTSRASADGARAEIITSAGEVLFAVVVYRQMVAGYCRAQSSLEKKDGEERKKVREKEQEKEKDGQVGVVEEAKGGIR